MGFKMPFRQFVFCAVALMAACGPGGEKDATVLSSLKGQRIGIIVRVKKGFDVYGRNGAFDHQTLTLQKAWTLAQYVPDDVRNVLSPLLNIVVLEANQRPPEVTAGGSTNVELLSVNPLGTAATYPYDETTTRLITANKLDGLLFVDTEFFTEQAFTTSLGGKAYVLLADKNGKTGLHPTGFADGKASLTSAGAEALSGVFGGKVTTEDAAFQKAVREVSHGVAASLKDMIVPQLQ